MKTRKSYIRLIQLWGIIFLLGSNLSIMTFDVIRTYNDFNFRTQKIRTDYVAAQKQTIKNEVDRVVNMVNTKKERNDQSINLKIQGQVYKACSFADNMYRHKKEGNSDFKVIQKMIDFFSTERYILKHGSLFIINKEGKTILFSDKQKKECKTYGYKNLPGWEDTVKNLISITQQTGEGHYEYNWINPDNNNQFKKIIFVKKWKTLDWIIGIEENIFEIDKPIKLDMILTIKKVRFGKEGYIFINDFNGDAILANGEIVIGHKKLWEVFNKNPEKTKSLFEKEYNAAMKPSGDFVYYTMPKLTVSTKESPKVSFIYGIPEWKWIIGAGVYLDDIENSIAVMHSKLNYDIKKRMIYFFLISGGIILFYLLLFSWIQHRVKNDFNLFINCFKKIATSDEIINRDLVHFDEFYQLADYANKMLQDKINVQNDILNERERLLITLRSIGDGVITTDLSGRVRLMNPVAENLTGWKESEASGKELTEVFNIINTSNQEECENPIDKVISFGEIVELDSHTMLKSKNGEMYRISDSAAPIRQAEGNIIGVILVFRDVTEEYAKEKQLYENETKYREIFNAGSDAIFIHDAKTGDILDVNEPMLKMYGYTKTEVLSLDAGNVSSEILPYYKNNTFEKIKKIIVHSPHVFEWQAKKKNGDIFWIEVHLKVSKIGNEDRIMAVVRDISERKKSQEIIIQSEKMLSIGGLAAGMAHEINNPLAGMMQNASVILNRLTTITNKNKKIAQECGTTLSAINQFMEKRHVIKLLKLIHESGIRASEIVTNMLSFSRKSGYKWGVADIVSIMDSTLQIVENDYNMKKYYDFKKIKILKEYQDSILKIKCEQSKIQQVFTNILKNGAEAMAEENIELKNNQQELKESKFIIRIYQNSDFVKIEIEDNGPGMTKETRKRIFEPFFTTKGIGKGTGLGLSVSYFIITDNHKGQMFVESEEGKGTKFIIKLPINN